MSEKNIHKLFKAAKVLEKLSTEATPGPWESSCNESGHSEYENTCSVIDKTYGDTVADLNYLRHRRYNEVVAKDDGTADADFIATMDPELGLAIAQWLRDTVTWMSTPNSANYDGQALVVADLILKRS